MKKISYGGYRFPSEHEVGRSADVAGVGQARDRAQGELLAAAADHVRRMRLLHRLGLQDGVRQCPTASG
jgi:hypothetical protein